MFSKRIYMWMTAIVIVVSALSIAAQVPNPPAARGGRGGTGQGGRGDPWPGQKKLLFVADVQTGYHHDSLNHAMATVERIGRESKAFVTFLRTDSELITKQPIVGQGKYAGGNINVKPLDFFDAVFLLPSGDGTMSE